jgi:pyruvate,water dikinase
MWSMVRKKRNNAGKTPAIGELANCRADSSIPRQALKKIEAKFQHFQAILERNNQVLKQMTEMEERLHDNEPVELSYVVSSVRDIREGVAEIVDKMIELGGDDYLSLKEAFERCNWEIEQLQPTTAEIPEDDYVIPLERIDRDRAPSVGNKCAQLGELKNKLGLPVPDGFAISAHAYSYFIEYNNLQSRINERLRRVNIDDYEELERVSAEIRHMITSGKVPDVLAHLIRNACRELRERPGVYRFSVRSSAIGEDSHYSFAGQYATFLNCTFREVVERYRDVLASKFTPKALYYLATNALIEHNLAMGVGCMAMVRADASGVIYTRDPVNPQDNVLLINSIFGLGKLLVDGHQTPDTIRVRRSNGTLISTHTAFKPNRLVLREEGGTIEEPLSSSAHDRLSITEEQIGQLYSYALKIEQHYQTPQDIEWAIDHLGEIKILQSRPLQLVDEREAESVDMTGAEVLASGGTKVFPGAGSGPIFHVTSPGDIPGIPGGAVVVAPHPFAGLITVMGKVNGLITAVGGIASHMATIAREFRVPTLVGVDNAWELTEGEVVTIDGLRGVVYRGGHPELVASRSSDGRHGREGSYSLLKAILNRISRLNLIRPADPDFVPENCQTFHDITRFAHQMALKEMFQAAIELEGPGQLGVHLQTEIPLDVHIVCMGNDRLRHENKTVITEDEILSHTLKAIWDGIKMEGWPSMGHQKGIPTGMTTSNMSEEKRRTFAEDSFAIVSGDYLLLSLRMGYHVSTIETYCSDSVTKNFIRIQLKQGGAKRDRRIRRIQLITDILTVLGFDHMGSGDFLDSMIAYQDYDSIIEKLKLLGRLTILTKQLDMALSSDAVTDWYKDDMLRILGLAEDQDGSSG